MIPKPVRPRLKATQDLENAFTYCEREFGQRAALSLIDAIEASYDRISLVPAAGSTRYAHELGLPGLRSWSLQTHPIVIFYVEHDTHIEVWRLLHAQMDIPQTLQSPD